MAKFIFITDEADCREAAEIDEQSNNSNDEPVLVLPNLQAI